MRRVWNWVQEKLLGRSDIYFQGSCYMRRWRIGYGVLPRWLPGVRVHHIMRSDADREMHDHPFSFVSIILWGGYTEHGPNYSKRYGPGSIVWRRATDLHRLELDRPAWTLVIRGRIKRRWGFVYTGPWQFWEDFVRAKNAQGAGLSQTGRDFAAPSSLN